MGGNFRGYLVFILIILALLIIGCSKPITTKQPTIINDPQIVLSLIQEQADTKGFYVNYISGRSVRFENFEIFPIYLKQVDSKWILKGDYEGNDSVAFPTAIFSGNRAHICAEELIGGKKVYTIKRDVSKLCTNDKWDYYCTKQGCEALEKEEEGEDSGLNVSENDDELIAIGIVDGWEILETDLRVPRKCDFYDKWEGVVCKDFTVKPNASTVELDLSYFLENYVYHDLYSKVAYVHSIDLFGFDQDNMLCTFVNQNKTRDIIFEIEDCPDLPVGERIRIYMDITYTTLENELLEQSGEIVTLELED